jgi:hypothetical protein
MRAFILKIENDYLRGMRHGKVTFTKHRELARVFHREEDVRDMKNLCSGIAFKIMSVDVVVRELEIVQ